MSRTRWLRLMALVSVPVLFLTACPAEEEPEDEPTPTEEPEETDEPEVTRGDGVLRLGYVLPETGDLAFLGPPQIQGVELAVQQINEAGGVLGADVELDGGDEAGDTAVAAETADRLLQEGVDAIIGAAATGMTLAIIEQVTGAGVVQCSGSNTGPVLTDYEDDGFYFRTAPTDALQGPILAERIAGDGHTQIALAARADEYGEGLLDATRDALEEAGAEVVAEVLYDPNATTFDAEVQQLGDANPEAIALISFEEGAQLLQAMIEAGIGPQDLAVYGADGLASSDLPESVEPGNPNVLDGMTGTRPDASVDPEFQSSLEEFAPELDTFTFAPQVYDCVMITALAAVAAESDDPGVFVDEMLNVTRDGTECTTFAECVELLEQGEDIDYQGPSGATTFTDAGEPDVGTYEIWAFEEGEFAVLESGIESTLEE
ncbi:MAG TPA: ABC transporter substrate-binding protein [Egibacteraceae bacterium]|nr:ABC transporter substrate-binding protein [Egibacteraceae bacterium]